MTPRLLWTVTLLAACTEATTPDGPDLPQPAPVTAPSDGVCPDFGAQGLTTFSSAGVDRDVVIYTPRGDTTGMPLVFVWHGLTAPGATFTDSAATDMALAIDAEDYAKKNRAIVVVPAAFETSLAGIPVLLWGILFDEDAARDLALYDDLRACAASEAGADMTRVSSFGFSGGALWTSLLLMERGDTLSTAVTASGGTGQASPLLAYHTPAAALPALVIDGGPSDAWPDPSFPLVDFHAASVDLASHLAGDGDYVVTCEHGQGHSLPQDIWNKASKWLLRHTYGVTSPYATGEVEVPGGCAELEASAP